MKIEMQSRRPTFQKQIDAVKDAFGSRAGDLSAEQHQNAVAYAESRFGGGAPTANTSANLIPFMDKLTFHAYKITDRDVETLRAAGYSDDAIFELIVGGSLGTGLATWEAGLEAIDAFFAEEREEQHAA